MEYEINGSAGEMHEYELNGKLMYPMSVAASPSVAPQILIENASYGWTEELLDTWKARYHKDIFDMLISASRGAAAPSRHLHESSPGEEVAGGLFFDFGAVRTALTEMLRAGVGNSPGSYLVGMLLMKRRRI